MGLYIHQSGGGMQCREGGQGPGLLGRCQLSPDSALFFDNF